jgi:hypothetical protein
MCHKHKPFLMIMIISSVLVLAACAGQLAQGPAGPAGQKVSSARRPGGPEDRLAPMPPVSELTAADLTCTSAIADTTLIWSKEAQFRERSIHGTGGF